MRPRARLAAAAGVGVLTLIGVSMRVSNAYLYPTNWGFDARFNWEYIEMLRASWALRAPDVAWATSHPPLFYYLAAGMNALLGHPDTGVAVTAIRLASTCIGLAGIGLAVALVRRADPGNLQRAGLAALLLLFLPAHVYMSAMLNEEILAASLTSAALFGLVWVCLRPAGLRVERWRAVAIGLAAGLAWLTKLTGGLTLVVAVVTYAALGHRRGERPEAARRIALVLLVACASGGWYYARNLAVHGFVYPHAMPAHEVMFRMPPGDRDVMDYVRLPVATIADPQLLSPDLIHSVWGSTYATLWYDGHRFFLPSTGTGQRLWGVRILLLALLPTIAFAAALARALRRRGVADVPLLTLVGVTLAGYVLFTLRNPWFASVKGSYLLGLGIPFAYYASEELDRWARGHRLLAVLVWGGMIALAIAVGLVFTYGLILRKAEVPGLVWDAGDVG